MTKAAKQENSRSSFKIVVIIPLVWPGRCRSRRQARSLAGSRLSHIVHSSDEASSSDHER